MQTKEEKLKARLASQGRDAQKTQEELRSDLKKDQEANGEEVDKLQAELDSEEGKQAELDSEEASAFKEQAEMEHKLKEREAAAQDEKSELAKELEREKSDANQTEGELEDSLHKALVKKEKVTHDREVARKDLAYAKQFRQNETMRANHLYEVAKEKEGQIADEHAKLDHQLKDDQAALDAKEATMEESERSQKYVVHWLEGCVAFTWAIALYLVWERCRRDKMSKALMLTIAQKQKENDALRSNPAILAVSGLGKPLLGGGAPDRWDEYFCS